MNAPARETLLSEGVVAKLLRYVQVDSPSSSEGSGVPSTPEQWDMARLLEAELKNLGLVNIKVDEHAIVTAKLPGNTAGAPAIGLLAHFDTYPGTPGHGVKPIVHKNYAGGEIKLPAGPTLSPASHPALALVAGHDVITSDGSTLLGADDKAGVAEVMETICRLINNPALPHGDVLVGFTPDEETGKGVALFDVAGFGATAAYTFDGSVLGEVEDQNFNAKNLKITITGRNSHTGTAKGAMLNAVQIAAEFVSSIPATMRPETTTGYEGFIHADSIQGGAEEVVVKVLLRDFTDEGMAQKQAIVEGLLKNLELRYPGSKTACDLTGGYQNMKSYVDKDPRVVKLALQAVRDVGVEPIQKPIRGGTDGARLSVMGLPCPNLFTGGVNYHSRTEWASAQWMEKAVEASLRLVQLWAGEGSR
ncbi:MAG TPA: peptidase T [Symbiobacteriaceae bacterium]|nr:peptidase T [Symbiobacteriaceae bacterium]